MSRAAPLIGRANELRLALGVALIIGVLLAALATWGFAELSEEVREGTTQAFDDAVLRRIGEVRSEQLIYYMAEVTVLGNALVVMVVAGVAALFLWVTHHRYSAALLLAALVGTGLLTYVLKTGFDRPRPEVITWGTEVMTASFPSGHSSGAAATYGTLAYLAARLERRRLSRLLTVIGGLLVVLAIAASRLVLGVHYPSDVAAGFLVALAWVGFCMALLEAAERLIRRRVPEEREVEALPPMVEGRG